MLVYIHLFRVILDFDQLGAGSESNVRFSTFSHYNLTCLLLAGIARRPTNLRY